MIKRLCDLCGEPGEICHQTDYTLPGGDIVKVEITVHCETDFDVGICRLCAGKLFTATIGID